MMTGCRHEEMSGGAGQQGCQIWPVHCIELNSVIAETLCFFLTTVDDFLSRFVFTNVISV